MSIKIIEEDILNSGALIIAHQCNCCSVDAKGLAKSIFDKYPYANNYKNRIKNDKTTYSEPGTIEIFGEGTKEAPFIINIYAQYFPGVSEYANYTASLRRGWFKECLQHIEAFVKLNNIHLHNVAMPYNIGCGLAGGDWELYSKYLEESNLNIVLYKL